MFSNTILIAFGVLGLLGISVLLAIFFRRVVSTNTVHIVQSKRKTTSYGTGQVAGNVYYSWPSWVPHFGVTVIRLPVSNFDLSLKDYEAYDKDRVPFMVDVTAFFRINKTDVAAQRVENIEELKHQLLQIVQGAVRKVLASAVIDSIMTERAQFGQQFTAEVAEQLQQWGVESVKSMELMDIRDAHGSKVIANIMAKKTSHIDMESRLEVAKNRRMAETAEIEAQQTIDVRKQEAMQSVGERTAQAEQAVGIANEQSTQRVLVEKKATKTNEMEVLQVEKVRTAEIGKQEAIVGAEEEKQTKVIVAEGVLLAQQKEAEGKIALGEAEGRAQTAILMAPVTAQTTLAKEIGGNESYQKYLAMIEAIKAYIAVGGKQAEALVGADVKIFANAGQPVDGAKKVMDLFSSQGGTNISAMIEGLAQTPMGKAFLERLGVKTPPASTTESAPSAS